MAKKVQPIFMRRVPSGLAPVGPYDAERLEAYALDVVVEIMVRQRRSDKHHRLYWAMLGRVVENTDKYPTAEHLHKAIKLELGYVKPIYRFDGTVDYEPDSTAYQNMDQAQFNAYFNQAVALIIRHVLPGVDPVALVKEAERHAA